jgi:type IV pilus assembly protein PilQ
MKNRIHLIVALFLLFTADLVVGQTPEERRIQRAARGKEVVTQEELVSFKSDVPYKQALEMLNEMSKRFLRKPIVDAAPLTTPINVNIESMYWRDALELILRTNGLWYTETGDYIQVTRLGAGQQPSVPGAPAMAEVDSGAILAKAREITISAIFLEIDQGKLRESGINFNIFRGRDLNLGVEFFGAQRVASEIFGARIAPTDRRLAVDLDAALRIFESEQIGEIIARPQVTVRSGVQGRVQIGADFSVKERDFAGNVIDRFYSTGTILQVTPVVYMYGATPLIDLDVKVERSNVQPGTVSTIINKTDAKTRLVLLNGEESYVGGLVINEESKTRVGIPLLKDLPWWFFGLRYVFGYDATRVTRKELIVMIRAEFIPTIDERVNMTREAGADKMKQKLEESRQDLERRRTNKQ